MLVVQLFIDVDNLAYFLAISSSLTFLSLLRLCGITFLAISSSLTYLSLLRLCGITFHVGTYKLKSKNNNKILKKIPKNKLNYFFQSFLDIKLIMLIFLQESANLHFYKDSLII